MKKPRIKLEIKKYAKELFLTPKPGNPTEHFYSFQKIANIIEYKFKEKYQGASVCQWADAKKKIKNHGGTNIDYNLRILM